MKPTIISSLLAVAALISIVEARAQLPLPISSPIVSPVDGKSYILLGQSEWTDAQAEAVALGGNLATIASAADNAWIVSTFSDWANQPCNLWIGLYTTGDGSSLANYTWVDGSRPSFFNFAPGEPNYPQEQFTEIIGPGIGVSGMWNNWYDGTATGYNGGGQILPTLPMDGVVELAPEPKLLSLLVGLVVLRTFRVFQPARPLNCLKTTRNGR